MQDKWLQRRVTFEEAIEHLSRIWDSDNVVEFRLWHEERFLPGDELWWYDMGAWEGLSGECGYAIVRDQIIAYLHPVLRN